MCTMHSCEYGFGNEACELNRMIRMWRYMPLRRKRLKLIDKNVSLAHYDTAALIIIVIINTQRLLHLAGATFTHVKSKLSLTSNHVRNYDIDRIAAVGLTVLQPAGMHIHKKQN